MLGLLAIAPLWLGTLSTPTPVDVGVREAFRSVASAPAIRGAAIVTNSGARAAPSQSIVVDRTAGGLALAGSGPGGTWLALTRGGRSALQTLGVGSPPDPTPLIADLDRLLDPDRLARAAAEASWSTQPDGRLAAQLPPGDFADLIDARSLPLPTMKGLPEFVRASLGEPAVKSVRLEFVPRNGAPAQVRFEIVRTIPKAFAGEGEVEITIGGDAARPPEGVEWRTTVEFTPAGLESEGLPSAQATLAPLLADAPPPPKAPPATGASIDAISRRAGDLLAASDRDRNGRIDAAELGAERFAALDRFDADRDGSLTQPELAQAIRAAMTRRQTAPRK